MDRFTDRQIENMEAATAIIDKSGIQNMTIKNLATDIGLSEPALYRQILVCQNLHCTAILIARMIYCLVCWSILKRR